MQTTITLKLHSIIDVITNSSTEIYTYVGKYSIDKAYELLNEILKIAGSDKKAEDLFDVKLVLTEDLIDHFTCIDEEDWPSELENDEISKALLVEYNQLSNYTEKRAFIQNKIRPCLTENNRWEYFKTDNYSADTKLVITAKDKNISNADLFTKFFNLFKQDAIFG
jgi:hypothetical protein